MGGCVDLSLKVLGTNSSATSGTLPPVRDASIGEQLWPWTWAVGTGPGGSGYNLS